MSAENEAVVRRFYEEMCNGRKNEIASEIFAADHTMRDPQVPAGDGPDGMVAAVKPYQEAVNGHWGIEELFSCGDEVVVRWVGTGTHTGEINGIPPTGRDIRVDAISIHTVQDGLITRSREVWDTLGFLQQLGVLPTPS